MGVLTQRIINYYNYKRKNAKSLEDLKYLKERLEGNIRQAETVIFPKNRN